MANPDLRARVFTLLTHIPRGKVTTYGQLARLAGIANPRQVGQILHTNTTPEIYPCHRVIRADGSLASGYAFGERDGQRKMLEAENVAFKNGKVDLRIYGWQPA